MSRSYKKTPWCGDSKNKERKRIANNKVRSYLKNNKNTLINSDYKKVYESWDICDFGWITTWDEYWNDRLKLSQEHPEWFKKKPLNKKEEYRRWYKYYKMK
jgi:hypothetical protein